MGRLLASFFLCLVMATAARANCYVLQNNTDQPQKWAFSYDTDVGPGQLRALTMAPHDRYPSEGQWCWNGVPWKATVRVAAGSYRRSWSGAFVMGDGNGVSPSGTYTLEPVADAPPARASGPRAAAPAAGGLAAGGLAAGAASPRRPAQAPVQAVGDGWVTLGTNGGPVADASRSEPANLLIDGKDRYLVDCGDGAVERLAALRIPAQAVTAVFISHLHFDHTGGLFALLGLRQQTGPVAPLTIYGPPGTRRMVDGLIAAMGPADEAGYGFPGQPFKAAADMVKVVELTDGSSVKVGDMTVSAVQNTHYSFDKGSADDGAYKSLAYRFDLPRRSIVYTGDTGVSPAVTRLAEGADLLVSEVIDADAILATLRPPGAAGPAPAGLQQMQAHMTTQHLPAEEVGRMAAAAHVKAVVLTHQVPAADSEAKAAELARRVHGAYAGPVTVANDLDRF
jgi:ribonuclease BN (tRNA processing enzyme)